MFRFTNRSSTHYTSYFTKVHEETDPHDPLSFKMKHISVSLKYMQPTPRKAACSGFAPLHLYPCPLHENSTLHNNQQQHPLRYSVENSTVSGSNRVIWSLNKRIHSSIRDASIHGGVISSLTLTAWRIYEVANPTMTKAWLMNIN